MRKRPHSKKESGERQVKKSKREGEGEKKQIAREIRERQTKLEKINEVQRRFSEKWIQDQCLMKKDPLMNVLSSLIGPCSMKNIDTIGHHDDISGNYGNSNVCESLDFHPEPLDPDVIKKLRNRLERIQDLFSAFWNGYPRNCQCWQGNGGARC